MTPARPAATLSSRPALFALLVVVGAAALAPSGALADSAVVERDLLGLRSEPAADAPLVDRVKKGERLEILERRNAWLRVTTGVTTGWVPGGLVRVEKTPAPPVGELAAPAPPPVVAAPEAAAPTRPRGPTPVALPTVMRSPGLFRAGGPWSVEAEVANLDAVLGEAMLHDRGEGRAFVTLERLSEDARIDLAIAMVRRQPVGVEFDGVEAGGRLRAVAVVVDGLRRR